MSHNSSNGHNAQKRLINYRRVSTKDQKDFGRSLPDQLRLNHQYIAGLEGYASLDRDRAGHFEEDISGATQFEQRPIGARVVRLLKSGKASGILVHVADRLYRDLPEALIMVRDLLRDGFEIHTTNLGRIYRETDIRFIIESWQADEERDRTRERTTRGRLAKARSGRWVGSGFVPYGYVKLGLGKDASLKIHAEHAKTVRLIFKLYTDTAKRRSIRSIATHLNERGVPPPSKKRARWSYIGVRSILSRSAYCGDFTYGRGPERVTIHLLHLALINHETFKRVQNRLEENRWLNLRRARHPYLLSGYLFCACGARMYGMWRNRSTRYYYCDNRRDKLASGTPVPICPYHFGLRAEVETEAWEWLRRGIKTKVDAGDLTGQIHTERGDIRQQLAELDEKIKAARSRVRNLVAKFGDSPDDDIQAELQVSQETRDTLISDRTALTERSEQAASERRDAASVIERLAEFRRRVDKASYEQKRVILAALRFRARLRPEQGTLWLDLSCLLGTESLRIRA